MKPYLDWLETEKRELSNTICNIDTSLRLRLHYLLNGHSPEEIKIMAKIYLQGLNSEIDKQKVKQ